MRRRRRRRSDGWSSCWWRPSAGGPGGQLVAEGPGGEVVQAVLDCWVGCLGVGRLGSPLVIVGAVVTTARGDVDDPPGGPLPIRSRSRQCRRRRAPTNPPHGRMPRPSRSRWRRRRSTCPTRCSANLQRRLELTHWTVDAGEVEGVPVHFRRRPGGRPRPGPADLHPRLPWTFWHWAKVVDPLADPGAHGGAPAEAFEVIVPSPPSGAPPAARAPGPELLEGRRPVAHPAVQPGASVRRPG